MRHYLRNSLAAAALLPALFFSTPARADPDPEEVQAVQNLVRLATICEDKKTYIPEELGREVDDTQLLIRLIYEEAPETNPFAINYSYKKAPQPIILTYTPKPIASYYPPIADSDMLGDLHKKVGQGIRDILSGTIDVVGGGIADVINGTNK